MKSITIYTDGACSGNPGPGGWGAILKYGTHEKELSGGEAHTTNNRMELLGAISALSALREACIVELWTDSRYLCDGLSKGWAADWRKRGWVKKDKKPALNPDLWGELLDLCERHEVHLHWVKGHADNPYNNRCDALAVAQSRAFSEGTVSAEALKNKETRKKATTMGKFVISKAKNGEYTFNLKAGNGEVILTASETYTTESACRGGIDSVKRNALAQIEDQTKGEEKTNPKFEVYEDKAGEFRFRLKAKNGQNIGKSEGYKAKASCLNGIDSVGRNAPEADIVLDIPEE